MRKCKKVVKLPRWEQKPFKKWTDDQKIYFLHELLDHFNRVPPVGAKLATEMLSYVLYEPADRYSHGMIPNYPKYRDALHSEGCGEKI